MKNNLAKQIAHKILLENKLYSLSDYKDLQRIIKSNQFTIIEYKKHVNSEPVSELINKLGVENNVEHNDSFLYVKNNLKFLFINSGVPEEDKCSLIRHELGHIYDPDLMNNEMSYSKIKKEEFANEFSFYIKNPGIGLKLKLFIIKKWKLLVGITALIACILGLSFMINSLIIKPVSSDISTSNISDSTYYVTSAGKKYHRKHCIIIKYKNNLTKINLNDAINDGYKPCLICNPKK